MVALREKKHKYLVNKLLTWFNLRPEEGERTLLLFAVFTATSMGMLWVEQTSIALFLESFGVKLLPLIYICSSLLGSALGIIYSWLQRNFPIQKVLIVVVLIMTLPLLVFRVGLSGNYLQGFLGLLTVFLFRLWIDVQEILNDLNVQLAANQLFNIREIKRTYPIISSGLLLADVLAGFSLPLLLLIFGLKNISILALFIMLGGGFILYKITTIYPQSFPNTRLKEPPKKETNLFAQPAKNAPLDYLILLMIFFVMSKVLYLLVEFNYLGQLEVKFEANQIASFLGLFAGILGVFELLMQLFVSSRAVEKLGVFISSMFLPGFLLIAGIGTIICQNISSNFNVSTIQLLFANAVVIKFIDELFHYTIIAGIKPFLFQPLPVKIRGSIQALVQGVAEPIATGITGIIILATVSLLNRIITPENIEKLAKVQSIIFVIAIILCSLIWGVSIWYLRSSYITLLVQEAEQGRLGFSNVDLTAFKRAILEALNNKEADTDKSSCIDLLSKIDPMNATEILAPKLLDLSPDLQKQSLEVMLHYPNPKCLLSVQKLIYSDPPLDVLALSYRYAWLSQIDLDLRILKPYLNDNVPSILRSTAATLILQRGDNEDKDEAIAVVENMLESPDDQDKILAIETLKDGAPNFIIKRYLPKLLKQKSPEIRCALFELIAENNLNDYYHLLLQGFYDKSLREAAKSSLIYLGNEVVPLLKEFVEDKNKPDLIRSLAWNSLAEIGTTPVYDALVQQLLTSWGITRRNLLRLILRIPNELGLDAVMERLGRSVIETLIDQELLILGQIYVAKIDLNPQLIPARETELIQDALEGMQIDILERCFLLMKLLYPIETIEAAIVNLNSGNSTSIALGLELLENGIDLPQKTLFLQLFEQGLPLKTEQLEVIKSIISYQPMAPKDRLLHLLTFRHFLSDWCLACCFHLARLQKWQLSQQVTTLSLRNPNGFVREAVLTYIKEANPARCLQIIAKIEKDSNPLVSALIKQIKNELS
jgi:hypothetical protein